MIKKFSKKIKNRQKTRATAQNKKQKPHYSIQMMFNIFPFGRWPVDFDALFALMGSNGSGGKGFGEGEVGGLWFCLALVRFGFGI